MVGEETGMKFCIDYIAKIHAGKKIIDSVPEDGIQSGDIMCYVQPGNEPCFCIAQDSDRVRMFHEGREKFVFRAALRRAGYEFVGGIRVG
jgi:hypothetical protein